MLRRLPPLNALRAFEAAARHGSFVGAAQELNVTPTAVSHQVKALEDRLGKSLFHRLPRGLDLTEHGRAYADQLTEGFNLLSQAESALYEQSPRGTLLIKAQASFVNLWLVPRLASFKNQYPDIDLRIIGQAGRMTLTDDLFDLAVLYGSGDFPTFWSQQIFTESVFPVCSPRLMNADPPLRELDDLRHHTLLHQMDLYEYESSLGWRSWLRQAGLPLSLNDHGVFFNDAMALYRAATNDLGVAVGRSVLLSELLASGRLVRPFSEVRKAESAYYVVVPEQKVNDGRVRAFIDWITEQAIRGADAGADLEELLF